MSHHMRHLQSEFTTAHDSLILNALTNTALMLLSLLIFFFFVPLFGQLRRLHHEGLLPTGGGRFNPEAAGVRRPRRSHHHRPVYTVLVSHRRGEEAVQPQTAAGTEVRLEISNYSVGIFTWQTRCSCTSLLSCSYACSRSSFCGGF